MRWVVVGNPDNRRVGLLQAALASAGLAPARVLAWIDLLRGRAALEEALAPGTVLRLESPGEDAAVERELIALGADLPDPERPRAARIPAAGARALPDERGRLRFPRQWYLGFRAALLRCAAALEAAPPGVVPTSDPRDVACMFDKPACQARLAAAGVAIPPGLGSIASWDELRAAMRAAGRPRVFVKLSAGSSASGVVALETRPGQVLAHTTVELVRQGGEARLYNSLRVRRYTDEREVALIVDALLAEGAQVEAWLPKATLAGRRFDLRVVAIDGRAKHVVVRTSRSPLTNLHLGNRRGDPAAARALLGEPRWAEALTLVERAAGAFPRTRHLGVDLLVGASLRRLAVLEVNAFGDLLPHALHEGRDTYAAEVAAVEAHGLEVA